MDFILAKFYKPDYNNKYIIKAIEIPCAEACSRGTAQSPVPVQAMTTE